MLNERTSQGRQLVVGLTGLAACGKGTAGKYLKEKHGFEHMVFSDMIKEEGQKRGVLEGKSLEETKSILSKLGNDWRKETGHNDIVAQKVIEKIKATKPEKVVIDGFRSEEEVELFRKTFANFFLIGIMAPPERRWERRFKDDPSSKKEDFEERDRNDVEKKSLGKVMEMADASVDNDGTKEELYRQLDSIVSRLAEGTA